jgi:Kdo2-lipid IVA lauroyltransferase/acyltransferase
MSLRKKLARDVVVIFVQVAVKLARLLPWRWGVKFGSGLGISAFYLLRKERQRILDHLQIGFGDSLSDEERNRIALDCFAHLGMGFFEMLNFSKLSKINLADYVEFEGEEHLTKVLSQGRGVIYVTGHIGNWELMGTALALRGYALKVVAAPVYDDRLDVLMTQQRARFGIETIRRGTPGAARRILSGLRQGCIMGFLIDQDTDVQGTFVDFFGQPAYTPTGPATLALHRETPVIMGFIHRLESGRHRISIEEPFSPVCTGRGKAEDIQANTAIFTRHLEAYIRKRPEQWVWMHRRWAKGKSLLRDPHREAEVHV